MTLRPHPPEEAGVELAHIETHRVHAAQLRLIARREAAAPRTLGFLARIDEVAHPGHVLTGTQIPAQIARDLLRNVLPVAAIAVLKHIDHARPEDARTQFCLEAAVHLHGHVDLELNILITHGIHRQQTKSYVADTRPCRTTEHDHHQ